MGLNKFTYVFLLAQLFFSQVLIVAAHDQSYADLKTVFERVIPIGSCCFTRSQINKYFNPSEDWTQTKTGKAELFDWVLISNYERLTQAFTTKLTDVFALENLDVLEPPSTSSQPNQTIIDKLYQVQWPHLFHDHTDLGKEESLTKAKISDVYPRIQSKITYLKEKFLTAATQKNPLCDCKFGHAS